MAANDLATLAQAKLWLPTVAESADNDLLRGLISASTQMILTNLQRSTVLSKTYTDVFSGYGQQGQMLRNWPVTSVIGMSINANTVAPSLASSNPNNGFVCTPWDGVLPGGPQMLFLRGQVFCDGQQNIAITYKAGYLVSSEAQTIPATPYAITALQLDGPWAQDDAVSIDGVAAVKVTGTPIAGQYAVANGVYTFAAADTGKAVLLSYSFIPSPLNQACVMLVAELLRYRERIGKKSITAPGPTTVAFDNSMMTDAIKVMISQFCNVVPIQ